MAYYALLDFEANIFVEKTSTGVKVDGQSHTLVGEQVIEKGLHIFTVFFDKKVISLGKDYYAWRMGAVSFDVWSHRLNKPVEEWEDEECPTKFLIDGTIYEVEDADRSWPLPALRLDGELVGYIDAETDETGATIQKVKWIN